VAGQHPAGTAQPVRQVAAVGPRVGGQPAGDLGAAGGQPYPGGAHAPTAARETLDHTIRLAFTNALNEIYLAAALTGLAAGLLCLTLIRPPQHGQYGNAKDGKAGKGRPEWPRSRAETECLRSGASASE
jgi:hypothetical protein